MVDDACLASFRATVRTRGVELYRDLPWRRTRDPYAIWISEVMLQQTQTTRVDGRWQRWLERFPTADALAAADSGDVLDEWQGLGYNRRALAVHRAAQAVSQAGGQLPSEAPLLQALPGIGPATAAGIRAFAFDLHSVYLETNVRTVFLHELYPSSDGVADSELVPLVRDTCPADDSDPADDPRTWYYALLDYGAYLKRTVPNPSRRSRTHVRQSRFEGSHRQKRAELLRVLLAHKGDASAGADFETIVYELSREEEKAGRTALGSADVQVLLDELSDEGFCHLEHDTWRI
ncbi:HhH-GPD family protein [Thermophilibacter immobilis]|uniref:Adenine glycosylase n=1 Tax=Thermophilibacter immobilis TaxID=2779519 RepID=A0A7S7M893_9ACTN|nr:adenine glycosylase [Thermophilibacter immobilis]QOY60579.1 adenine glycosylase [Thermophilibacter immobilis]